MTHVRNHEPGTKLYLSRQDAEEPTRFLHVMIFEDEAAENIHAKSEAVDRLTGILYPKTVDGVTLKRYTGVGPGRSPD